MKRFIQAVALLLAFAGAVEAQETYDQAASSEDVANLRMGVSMANDKTCLRLSQQIGCNQSQACIAAGAVGGSGCSNANARAVNARIYPDTLAGRDEFVTFVIVLPRFNDLIAAVPAWEYKRQCDHWNASNQTVRDSMCTAANRSAGCKLCP
jgi:hypothetical protein